MAVDDCPHVANMHALFEQILQDLLYGRERQELGSQIFHQLRRIFRQPVQQLLHFHAAEQFRRVGMHQVIQMRGHDRAGVDHGITQNLGLLALIGFDPDGRQPKSGIAGGKARQECPKHCLG